MRLHLRPGDSLRDGFAWQLQTACNGEPQCPSRLCKSTEGSGKEEGGQYSPASTFQGSLQSNPVCPLGGTLKAPAGITMAPGRGACSTLGHQERSRIIPGKLSGDKSRDVSPGIQARAEYRQAIRSTGCLGYGSYQSCFIDFWGEFIYIDLYLVLSIYPVDPPNRIRFHLPTKHPFFDL